MNRDILRLIAVHLPQYYLVDFFLSATCCNFTRDELFWKLKIIHDFPAISYNPIISYRSIYHKLLYFNHGRATIFDSVNYKLLAKKGDIVKYDSISYLYSTKLLGNPRSIPMDIRVIEQYPVDYWEDRYINYYYECYIDMTPYLSQIKENEITTTSGIISDFIDWRGIKYGVQYFTGNDLNGLKQWRYNGDDTFTYSWFNL